MNRRQTRHFGKIYAPETVDELLKLVLQPEHRGRDNVWMWRGQANIAWRVDSSAYRRLKLTKRNPSDRDLISYEKQLIKKARYRGYDLLEGQPMSDFDVLARLQHHGAATRLLDATRNALIGLYFASEAHEDKAGVLLGFHCWHLGGYEDNGEPRGYDEVVAELGDQQYSWTWQPPDVSKRIAAQHSQFLYSSVKTQAHGSVGVDDDSNSMVAIAIEPDLKHQVLSVLSDTFDIRYPTLFPDLEGFCQSNSVRYSEYHFHRW
ncbi:FRG domain-containing protein [Aurantiacibacter sp. MUD61]|uniref:FRG domain-containing protein n=1 Tax=Aurantiacibacter sp. MUD61 TaxID=3009083 RepID=UPI0022F02A19|nr:FRG domain-containing protein [Aurantiacibacter sp. MUD61]